MQLAQAAPLIPQLVAVAVAVQVFAEQQPVGHDVASQTHAAFTHRWPAAQAAPVVPQTQLPVAEQESAVAGQLRHVAPIEPQVEAVCEVQTFPAPQQPPAQDAAVQEQLPAVHCWPSAQAALVPHRQVPELEQLSACNAVQAEQLAPAPPHSAAVSGLQTFAVQQPLGQVLWSQRQVPPAQR